MKVRSSIVVSSALCLVILAFVPGCSVSARAKKGRAILERTADFYRTLDSVRFTMDRRVDLGEGPNAAGGSWSIAMARPRSLSAIPPAGDYTLRFVQNDEHLYAEIPFRRQYVLADSLEFGELEHDLGGALTDKGLVFLLHLGMGAPGSGLPLDARRVAYLGSERLDGIRCRRLVLNIGENWHEIWIAKGRKPWLIRYWKPVTWLRPGGESPSPMARPGVPGAFEFRYRDWQADPDLTGAFTIRPREEFERVATLFYPPQDSAGSSAPPGRPISAGSAAPDVRLHPMDGEPLALSDLKGRVVVLDFWATWCEPCIIDLPRVHEAASRFSGEEVLLLAVNRWDRESVVRDFLAQRGWELPVALDDGGAVSSAFGVSNLPSLVLIDRAGTVRKVVTGAYPGTERDLENEIETLLIDPSSRLPDSTDGNF